MADKKEKIIIIGGGVVGVCCALHLRSNGHDVTLIDRNPIGEGTALASCGFLAVSDIIPLSRPDMLVKAPKWLLKPESPLHIHGKSLLSVLPWLTRFAFNSRPGRIKNIARDMHALTRTAAEDYQALLSEFGLTDMIGTNPIIKVFDTENQLNGIRPIHQACREFGYNIREISGSEAAELEPALSHTFEKAVIYEDWRQISDSRRFVTAMATAFQAIGGNILQDEAVGFEIQQSTVSKVLLKDRDSIAGDRIILSAGVWSKALAARLGTKISLISAAGYQTLVNNIEPALKYSIVYPEGGVGITPYERGIGIGGSIEFSGINSKPNFKRARILLQRARRVIPDLDTSNGEERIGRRPMCPDTIPVIDRVSRFPNVILATGHGQLGVTLGATTAKLVGQLISGKPPSIDLSPYRSTRF
jgi:D-amino-acid dehydrogenase